MGALKKRDLKQKVKEKIAADIVKRKGDVSKSDDRYAYESVEVVSEGPLGDIAGGCIRCFMLVDQWVLLLVQQRF